MTVGDVSGFLDRNFRHFNARETVEAARGYRAHVDAYVAEHAEDSFW